MSFAPAFAKRYAVSLPIPELEPVIKITCPFTFPFPRSDAPLGLLLAPLRRSVRRSYAQSIILQNKHSSPVPYSHMVDRTDHGETLPIRLPDRFLHFIVVHDKIITDILHEGTDVSKTDLFICLD